MTLSANDITFPGDPPPLDDPSGASASSLAIELVSPGADRAAVAAPTAPIFRADAAEGGKEGAADEPPTPPSNAAFLTFVMRDVAEGADAAVCSKAGDPTSGGWGAEKAVDVDRQCPPDRNNYLNCASFAPGDDGAVQARKEAFSGFHFLLLDDVGTKVDRKMLASVTPTWEIETSPGNSQLGFRLEPPIRDLAVVKRLQDAVMAAGLCDKGAGGAGRWARLPIAINGKAKYRDADGLPFRCRLARWSPDAAYTMQSLADALGLTLQPPSPAASMIIPSASPSPVQSTAIGSDVFRPMPAESPVVTALKERGLYKRQLGPGKHDVTCPWVGEHTDGIDGGSAYFEPDADRPVGGYCCQHSHGARYRIGQLIQFLGVPSDQARGKARIDVLPGEMNRVRRAAELTLALRGGHYQSGGAIVVVRTDPATGDVTTELLGEAALTAALSDAADWYRYDGRSQKSVRVDPPARNVQTLLKAAQFEYLPVLRRLARQPFFREGTGELVSTPGYDAGSQCYAAFDAGKFDVREPTEEEARRALAKLNELISEFRFATDADRSAAICAMLTGAVRSVLPTAPAFNVTASAPGSGKSYLAEVISPFAGPGAALKLPYPTTKEEAGKVILATFLGAPAAMVFDDMQGPWFPYGPINSALTSETVSGRVLGFSRNVSVSTRSLILGTGNNVRPLGDMTRRVLTIRLYHRTATPALVRYFGKPAEQMATRREEYVAAALTIVAAWKRAGSPMIDVPSIGSYEQWSDLCRQPLLWLGLEDPAASIIAQLHHNPEQDAFGNLLKVWHAEIGGRAIMLRDVLTVAADRPDLHEALLDLPVVERETINRSKFGQYLSHNANRIVDGLELQAAPCSRRNAWRVVQIEPEAA